ncbi:hypothetical protein OOK41_01235 [Micromonospora sp. NBC_01655]|uniref:hypothetical protein n=1 Tax=Micromonospora sp. NBC_01655 TaxID=2975983 RepID=UPI00224E05E5|nr:hypothetical protein [Micromonospora sp. NBC_01655]MCX4468947.1 hypothetical protein [Micromonospora sp. NBC_01655]
MTNLQPQPAVAQPPEALATRVPGGLPELPVCGGPATLRVGLASPAAGRPDGRPEGSVYVCTGDLDYVLATVAAAGLTSCVMAGDGGRRCGDGVDLRHAVQMVLLTPPDAAAGPLVWPVPVPQPAGRRIARAGMLQSLSRLLYSVDDQVALPAPVTVRFMDHDDQVVLVRCDTIDEAAQWAVRFDVVEGAEIADTITASGHQVRVYTAWAQWRGYALVLAAVVPPEGDPVPLAVRPSPVDAPATVVSSPVAVS